MKYRINNQVVLSQIPLGPLAAHIGSFADFINAQGYALYSIHRQVRLAADFSQWLKLKGIELHRNEAYLSMFVICGLQEAS